MQIILKVGSTEFTWLKKKQLQNTSGFSFRYFEKAVCDSELHVLLSKLHQSYYFSRTCFFFQKNIDKANDKFS